MANLIQVKRSLTTATPGSLANGEFAYTANGDVLFIGSNATVVAIGGKRTPGVLTANQALVANSTSGIDKIITSNATIGTMWANGTQGTAGQYLASNGTATYWVTASASAATGGANTQIQFNDSAAFGGSAGFTFNKTTNNVLVANTLTVGTATVNTTNYTGTANNATNLGGAAASAYATLAASQTFAGNNTVAGTNTVFSSNVTISSANINATSALLSIRDITVSGNLIVSGAVTTLNTTTLTVNDNIIELALNNTTTDAVDTGLFSAAGNSSVQWYSGLARIAASSNSSSPFFKLFVTSTNPNTATTIDTSTVNTKTGTLQAYLAPFGVGGGFVANATNFQVTANSTYFANFTANSLTLTTALVATSGGTGLASYTNQDILVANTTNGFNKLGLGADGTVLQVSGTALAYGTLDGGTF